MEFKFHLIFTFLFVAVLTSHAALPSMVYWNSMLPQTPMPKAVKDLLHNEWSEDKRTSVEVGTGGVNVNAGKGKPGTAPGTGVNNEKPATNVGVGKGGVVVTTGPKKKPVYVGVTPGPSPFVYKYAATEDQLHYNPNVALFFLEKDLHPGSSMNLHFVKSSTLSTLLPRKVSESIPFSSKYIPEIYEKFSVKPSSREAEIIKETLTECEEPGIKGEEKYCATSLESMIDFSISKLGKNVHAISTEAEKETQLQKYTIARVKKVTRDKAVVCHNQNYAYAVFYCHKTQSTEAFEVSLVGADGTKVKAVAACHKDTSEWNPKHLAFQVLNVKPGSVPVCHFLPEDHIVWVTK